ncbi:VWA domain-containing protein [bacterium]|nr:VWA domain-containing protein [bacterium]
MDGEVRWRLVLGRAAQGALGQRLDQQQQDCDQALSWLYERDQELLGRGVRPSQAPRRGGSEDPSLEVVEWLERIHQLFPKETIERLERDAVEKYQIEEVVTNAEALRRVKPNLTLVQAVLRTRNLMNQEVLQLARELVRQVVGELLEKLAREVEAAFSGARRLRGSTSFRHGRELDPHATIRANLRHYDLQAGRLVVEKPYFFRRGRRQRLPWQLILLVDQSGSMLESVIHSAVTASCLWGVAWLKTQLVVFSTEVVDLSHELDDPVETLMRVQLGGGTDICRAVDYAAGLVDHPRRSVVVLISDFFEGGDRRRLVRTVGELAAQGTLVLGLASLNPEATPVYDRELARELVEAGAEVAAMTPGQLAGWLAEKMA